MGLPVAMQQSAAQRQFAFSIAPHIAFGSALFTARSAYRYRQLQVRAFGFSPPGPPKIDQESGSSCSSPINPDSRTLRYR